MNKATITAEPGKFDLNIVRTVNFPKDLVWKAYTDKNLVAQWWGLRESTLTIDKFDPRKGGMWRFISSEKDGQEYAFNGVFHDVIPNEKIIQTFEFEPLMGHVCLETMTLEEKDGKTTIHAHSVFQSIEDRDGMLASGMEIGANESYDRLEELLGKLS